MKHYFKLVIIMAIIYIFAMMALFCFFGRIHAGRPATNDVTLMLNELTKAAELNWDSLEDGLDKSYDYDYVILDNTSDIRYTNRDEISSDERLSVEMAMRNRFPYSYVFDHDKCIGSVIILDDGQGELSRTTNRLLGLLGLGGFIVIAGAIMIGIYIDKNIYKPFKQMEGFAGKVAEGKLDAPLIMDRQNIFGSFTESFDIMREELVRSREREIALQKKERELVASLSHDLKTPITGIKVTAELLQAKLLADNLPERIDYADKLKSIMKKADQIDLLVSDLFSSTLDDLGEIKVNLSDEEARCLNDIVASCDDRKLCRCAKALPLIINVDLRRMGQVIGNIISNSYKYANTAIDVDYKIVDDYLAMCIRDYGPGVSASELALITNKFYRGQLGQKSGQEGSGLGLYIAKMLMMKMNGELIVASDDKGLAITLLIPLS